MELLISRLPTWALAVVLPLWGSLGFVLSPRLWKHAVFPMLVTLPLTILILTLLFMYAFGPQEEYLNSHGWPSWLSRSTAVVAVLIEDGLVSLFIFTVFFTFVATNITSDVLIEKGVVARLQQDHAVDEENYFVHRMHGVAGMQDLGCMRSIRNALCFLALRLPLWLLSLPFILAFPLVAPWVVLPLFDGWAYTWSLLTDFLAMIHISNCKSQARYVREHMLPIALFGFTAMFFQLVPGLGVLFLFGAPYGVALLFERFLEDDAMIAKSGPGSGGALVAPLLPSNEK